jgi:hypothetical protein
MSALSFFTHEESFTKIMNNNGSQHNSICVTEEAVSSGSIVGAGGKAGIVDLLATEKPMTRPG